MAEIVNLRGARKVKARTEVVAKADANRAKHGVPKCARDLAKARNESSARMAEAHKLGGKS
jgi:hypothetical protein